MTDEKMPRNLRGIFISGESACCAETEVLTFWQKRGRRFWSLPG